MAGCKVAHCNVRRTPMWKWKGRKQQDGRHCAFVHSAVRLCEKLARANRFDVNLATDQVRRIWKKRCRRGNRMKMVEFNKMMMAMVMVVSMVSVTVQMEKVDGQVDIVVVTGWYLVGREPPILNGQVSKFVENHLELGLDKVRVAVANPSTTNTTDDSVLVSEKIYLNLTSDIDDFKRDFHNIDYHIHHKHPDGTLSYRFWMHLVFRAINEIIFESASQRARVVVCFAAIGSEVMNLVRTEVQNLLEKKVRIYVVAVDQSYYSGNLEGILDYERETVVPAKTYVGPGNEDRIFFIKDESDASGIDGLVRFKNRMVVDLCGYTPICRYHDDETGKCKQDVNDYQPPVQANQMIIKKPDCRSQKPKITCTKDNNTDDCRDTCDKYWPWESPVKDIDCNQFCDLVIRRKGAEPQGSKWVSEKLKEHCKHSVQCPPCHRGQNKTQREIEQEQKNKDTATSMMWLAIGLVIALVLILIAGPVGMVFFIRKRRAEKDVENKQMEGLMAAITHMSVYVAQEGAAQGTAADLPDLNESIMKLKKMINSPMTTPPGPSSPKQSSGKPESSKSPVSPKGSGQSSVKQKK